jgi:hypothetical protein
VVGVDGQYRQQQLLFNPLLDQQDVISRAIPDETEYLVFRNSLVESALDRILRAKASKRIVFIVKDSTHLFISSHKWKIYRKLGVRIEVMRRTRMIGLTINPVSPEAHAFPANEFLFKMKGRLNREDVFNLMSPGYRRSLESRGMPPNAYPAVATHN